VAPACPKEAGARADAAQLSRQPGGTGVPAGTRTATDDDVSTPPLLTCPELQTRITSPAAKPVEVLVPWGAGLPEVLASGTAQALTPTAKTTAVSARAEPRMRVSDLRATTSLSVPVQQRRQTDPQN
jgi:hypothetical protein